jgi:RNA polymerase sigma factor (sigma-70 family)
VSSADLLASVSAVLRRCDTELGWRLNEPELARHATALVPLLEHDASPAQIRLVAINFHADHALVAALQNVLHPGHEQAWSNWMRQILGVLRRAGMAWSSDPAIDDEDLAQIARAEIARALPAFRYRSRFSSWAYRVAVQSVTRQIRLAHAEKRAVRPDSLERLADEEAPAATADDPESAAAARLLAQRVADVLTAHTDPRLLAIFRQWAFEDRGTAEIGAVVRLHPSRVRALLAQAREALRADPVIKAWHDGGELRDEAA